MDKTLRLLRQASLNTKNGGDDDGGVVLLLFLFLIIGFLSVTTFLIRSGKLNSLISNISNKNPALGNLLGNIAGPRGPLGGAPGGASGGASGGALPAQAGGGAGNQQTTMQNIMENLGDNAGNIVAQVGVDIAAELASNQKKIAKYIMKRSMKTAATKALFEKGASKALKKTFTGRLKKVFTKLTTKAAAALGARWSKTAVQAGQTAARIEAKAAAAAAQKGSEIAARQASLMAAKQAAKTTTTASLGPIGWAYDAVTVVSIALDSTNAGNYAELSQTSDLLEIKKEIDREVLNVNLACSSVPPTADCPIDPDAPPAPVDPDATPMPGRYPSFFGPLDKEQSDDYTAFYQKLSDKVVDLVTTKPYTPRVQALFDQCNIQFGAVFAQAFRDAGVDPDTVTIPGITDAQFSQAFLAYWSDADSDYFYDKALESLCTDAGGVLFSPGAGYEKQCTYKTEEQCHAQYPWPPPDDDSKDLTYTEWRAKNWFGQFKNTDGSSTLDMSNIPEGGACIVASNGLHLLCDQEIETGSGKAKNEYRRNTGECYNSREVCRIKGVSYTDSMNPSEMANLTDHPLPSCYVDPSMQACENIVGITICRALQSGGDVAGARELLDTQISTGNAVGDFFGDQAEGLAASIGASYLTGREGLMAAFSSMLGGQQTYAQIQQQLDDTVAVAGNGLTNLANQAEGGSVTAALALPSAAIVAGASLSIAAIGSAFSALDTAVVDSRTTNWAFGGGSTAYNFCNTWGNIPGPPCAPGQTLIPASQTGCGDRCLCLAGNNNMTNGVCCPPFHTGSIVNGQGVCTPVPYPSWWNNGAAAGSCTTCYPSTLLARAVNRRTENVCYDRYDGYTWVGDWETGNYEQVFTNVCEPQEVYDTVYIEDPGWCRGKTPTQDPRAFASQDAYCASADADDAAREAAEQQGWLDSLAAAEASADGSWYTQQ